MLLPHISPQDLTKPKYLNTNIEGMFLQRLKLIQNLNEARNSLVYKEFDIALACCPYFLGQVVWRLISPRGTRVECIVSRILFQPIPPYYKLFLSEKDIRGKWSRNPKQVRDIYTVVGVEHYFHEKPEEYHARLERLIADGVVKNKIEKSSVDSNYIMARCQATKLGEEVTRLRPELQSIIDRAFGKK